MVMKEKSRGEKIGCLDPSKAHSCLEYLNFVD
jgi:hypothetical protein